MTVLYGKFNHIIVATNFRSLAPVIQVGRGKCYYVLIKYIINFSCQKIMWKYNQGISWNNCKDAVLISNFLKIVNHWKWTMLYNMGFLWAALIFQKSSVEVFISLGYKKSLLDFWYAWEYNYRSLVTFSAYMFFICTGFTSAFLQVMEKYSFI